ncbi:ATP-binding cassette domain-containing protein [Microbacterium sp. SORGH_AS_0888]|uniref:ATP-binding cassette domain-containing protein n=1 Tax=Microbacterium sp. SORGH_AS_0888 TaxID=3041791 RepID=UPI0027846734|nr:ATP-binding cassette domain-containing protein [Microbacterium sp. SORGH_AS_0888]MDQ1128219.1 peptide/nickel transport system ATP-binding protein [Microbacterium sp. SORGH_AS_0888]
MLTLVGVQVHAPGNPDPLLTVRSLALRAGDRVVVRGPSGAGKSLLLNVLAGRLAPSLVLTGERHVAPGLDRIGIVPQRGIEALHPLLSLRSQLRAATGASRAEVDDMLGRVGLAPSTFGPRRPAELSGGQAQRAAIARAALTRAPVVIADEPTSALDPATRDEVVDVLSRSLDPGTALVVATHDAAVAAVLGAHRLDVSHGQVHDGGQA